MEKEYNEVLIIASVVVAFMTSFLSIAFASSIVWSQRYQSLLWNVGAAVIMGLGIWTMHFIGMLALHLDVSVRFDYGLTAASAAVAVAVSYVAFRLLLKPNASHVYKILAALTLGSGVLMMHYMGMEAMKMFPPIQYDPWLVLASVIIAYGASYVGLDIFHRTSQRDKHNVFVWYNLLAAVVIGSAISLMHYVGMFAANFPANAYCTVDQGVELGPLSIYVVGTVAFILITAFMFLIYEQGKDTKRYLAEVEALNTSLEQRIQERTAEIAQALSNLQKTQKQLIESEKFASLGSLVAGVAHEINTPLGIGVTSSSLLGEHIQQLEQHFHHKTLTQSAFARFFEQAKESHTILSDSLHRAAHLVVSFKQLATDQSSDQFYTFNVLESIDNTVKSLTHLLKAKQIKVNVTGDPQLTIHSNPGALSQVMTNLLMNACVHAFEQSDSANYIQIAVTETATAVEVQFSDNGLGMAPEVLGRIFEPFFTTRRGRGGSGLGLNLVYNIVTQKLKGNIHVTSIVGQGTVFNFSIANDVDSDSET